MYVYSKKRRRGVGELGPDPGGEAPPAVDCLLGAGPLEVGQSFCEGNDKVLKMVRDMWEAATPPAPPAGSLNLQKYLVPVGVGVLALFLFSAARGRG